MYNIPKGQNRLRWSTLHNSMVAESPEPFWRENFGAKILARNSYEYVSTTRHLVGIPRVFGYPKVQPYVLLPHQVITGH